MFGKGKSNRNKSQQRRMGTSHFGACICPQCNYSVMHKRGLPCHSLKCPICNIPLIRWTESGTSKHQQPPDPNTKTSSFPKIDAEICKGCGLCIDKCPSGAIYLEDGIAKIATANCKKCRVCIDACKFGAIA